MQGPRGLESAKGQDMNTARIIPNQRRDGRVALEGRVAYRYGSTESGVGRWADISERGGCLTMGRYLRPGTYLMVKPTEASRTAQNDELKARVVWCRCVAGSSEFAAGIRIFLDEPSAWQTVEGLLLRAMCRFWTEHRQGVHLPRFRNAKAPTPKLAH